MSNHLIVLFLLVGMWPSVAGAAETAAATTQPAGREEKIDSIRDFVRRADTDIEFYGRILDQFERPVEGVEVTLRVGQFSADVNAYFSRSKTVRVQTDSQGVFTVTQERGRSLYVEDIRKEGYECVLGQEPDRGYNYEAHSKRRFIPDRDTPVVWHVRKLGATAFLLQDKYLNFQISAARSGSTIGYDFVERCRVATYERPTATSSRLVRDLQVKAVFNADSVTWTVTLSSGTPNGGIIVSEQALYEAPETGYQTEYTFAPKDSPPVKAKYIYLRSREPAIYSRIEIRDISANGTFLELLASSVTNPYGDRNLEQAPNLPFEVSKQLTDEARVAFSRKQRPGRPDLPKMIQEAKEKTEKAKAEKEKATQGDAVGQP